MKLVLTGGPSAGKTTIAHAIAQRFYDRVVVVPESATVLFSGGFVRRHYEEGIKLQQKAIYAVQVIQEQLYRTEHPERLLVCDRGTLDGLAYWPNGDEKEFLSVMSTDLTKELERYDWVIHLDTAHVDSYDRLNWLRTETPEEAVQLNEKIKLAWQNHPNRIIISHSRSFADKVNLILNIVEKILAGTPFRDITAWIKEQNGNKTESALGKKPLK